jgi:hypothetical protein
MLEITGLFLLSKYIIVKCHIMTNDEKRWCLQMNFFVLVFTSAHKEHL